LPLLTLSVTASLPFLFNKKKKIKRGRNNPNFSAANTERLPDLTNYTSKESKGNVMKIPQYITAIVISE